MSIRSTSRPARGTLAVGPVLRPRAHLGFAPLRASLRKPGGSGVQRERNFPHRDGLSGGIRTRLLGVTVVVAALLSLVAAQPAAARKNPYTAAGVCGPGYGVIDRHRLYDVNPATGERVKLAAVVLTYNAANGYNCAVTMKRYRVGKKARIFGDHLYVSLAARPLSEATVDGDAGNFRYFAGPTYVPARSRCVQWAGGATLLTPPNISPRGYFDDGFESRWEHCR
jgi:hypothetical protein